MSDTILYKRKSNVLNVLLNKAFSSSFLKIMNGGTKVPISFPLEMTNAVDDLNLLQLQACCFSDKVSHLV